MNFSQYSFHFQYVMMTLSPFTDADLRTDARNEAYHFSYRIKKQVGVGRIQNFNASKKCVVLENLRVVLCEIVM